jgi:hypothetical protein
VGGLGAAVSGGYSNTSNGMFSTVSGGYGNTVSLSAYQGVTIGGGNTLTYGGSANGEWHAGYDSASFPNGAVY